MPVDVTGEGRRVVAHLRGGVAEGDKVVVRATGRGTPTREFFGVPASNKQLVTPWIAIYRIAGGQIVEAWFQGDRLGLRQQAGLIGPDV